MSKNIASDQERYLAAAHAVQSGVAIEHARGSDDGSPKHLRTGVNIALRDMGSLVELLVAKGVITQDEYTRAVADGMEQEVRLYEERLTEAIGSKVRLG